MGPMFANGRRSARTDGGVAVDWPGETSLRAHPRLFPREDASLSFLLSMGDVCPSRNSCGHRSSCSSTATRAMSNGETRGEYGGGAMGGSPATMPNAFCDCIPMSANPAPTCLKGNPPRATSGSVKNLALASGPGGAGVAPMKRECCTLAAAAKSGMIVSGMPPVILPCGSPPLGAWASLLLVEPPRPRRCREAFCCPSSSPFVASCERACGSKGASVENSPNCAPPRGWPPHWCACCWAENGTGKCGG
mmetsp:Transcript_94947/g.268235  ORF Transcript_94947/g.268235 Transcript_94947/m.268235 type:complete len:249 (+) Transcript_94947:684-1430(+)